jgi:hypothetical protein
VPTREPRAQLAALPEQRSKRLGGDQDWTRARRQIDIEPVLVRLRRIALRPRVNPNLTFLGILARSANTASPATPRVSLRARRRAGAGAEEARERRLAKLKKSGAEPRNANSHPHPEGAGRLPAPPPSAGPPSHHPHLSGTFSSCCTLVFGRIRETAGVEARTYSSPFQLRRARWSRRAALSSPLHATLVRSNTQT